MVITRIICVRCNSLSGRVQSPRRPVCALRRLRFPPLPAGCSSSPFRVVNARHPANGYSRRNEIPRRKIGRDAFDERRRVCDSRESRSRNVVISRSVEDYARIANRESPGEGEGAVCPSGSVYAYSIVRRCGPGLSAGANWRRAEAGIRGATTSNSRYADEVRPPAPSYTPFPSPLRDTRVCSLYPK